LKNKLDEEKQHHDDMRLLVKNENISKAVAIQLEEIENKSEKYPVQLYKKAALNSHIKTELKSNNPQLILKRNNSLMIDRKEIPFVSINSFMKMWSKVCEDEFNFSSPPEILLDVHKELIDNGNSLFLNAIKIQDSNKLINNSILDSHVDEVFIAKEIQSSKLIYFYLL
jgi:hypothetical protein